MSVALPRPPTSLSGVHVESIAVGQVLHRNHASAFAATAFNPGRGQPSRFAPFASSTGDVVPTLYAAATREAAVHETLFHDIEAADPMKIVRRSVVESRTLSTVSPRRELRVATLFTPDLMRWGLTRGQLIDTPKTAYAATVLWAQAFHAADPDIDGLVWMSRRCDSDRCFVFFGDRIASSDLDTVQSSVVAGDAGLMAELGAFAARADITIVT